MSEQVDVLLATYQGAKYLECQLESILTQTHPNLHLVIRDDGSTDETLYILGRCIETYPNIITLIPPEGNLGIRGNFSALMRESKAPYIAFSDQDDKWLPHKIEESLDLLKAMERQYGSQLPLLVHTDLTVVDSSLNEIAHSFWRYAGVKEEATGINRMLVQNVPTGCTMLMNRCLADLAYPIPSTAIMHDWWIGLVASCFGHIQSLNKITVLYRQHDENDTGAKHYNIRSFLMRNKFQETKNSRCSAQTFVQARSFLERYHKDLPQETQELINAYLSIEQLPFFQQKKRILKYRFFKQGFLRNLKYLVS